MGQAPCSSSLLLANFELAVNEVAHRDNRNYSGDHCVASLHIHQTDTKNHDQQDQHEHDYISAPNSAQNFGLFLGCVYLLRSGSLI